MQSVVDSVTISQIKKIYVTGHSLGGALAAYGAADLAILLKAKYSFTNSNVLKMINFAAPYSANDAFYDFFTNGLAGSVTGVAVINERDVVPYLSVPLYAWRRLGAQYILHDPNYPALVDTYYSHQVSDHVHSLCSTLISSLEDGDVQHFAVIPIQWFVIRSIVTAR
jgi:pimeloyl-ACP methyl ester carboxylesterase